jgi:hypothetical protein
MRCGASQSSGSERPTGRQDCRPGGTPARSSSSAELADDDRGQPHGLDRAQPCRSNFHLVNNKSGVCSRFVYLFARTAAMPCYKNAYQPPPPPTYSSDIHLTTPAEVYDLNFCFNQPAIDNLKGDGRQVRRGPDLAPGCSSSSGRSKGLVSRPGGRPARAPGTDRRPELCSAEHHGAGMGDGHANARRRSRA